jgi:hypothetical protein
MLIELLQHICGGPISARIKPEWSFDHLNKAFSGLKAFVEWKVFESGIMSGMVTPGGAFIRSDDPQCAISVDYSLCFINVKYQRQMGAFD